MRENIRFSHDAAYKAVYGNKPMIQSLIRDLAHSSLAKKLDFSTLKRLSGEFVTLALTLGFSDAVWQIHFKDRRMPPLILLIEFQTRPQWLMSVRVANYATLLYQRLNKEGALPKKGGKPCLPLILPIIIHTGRARWRVPLDLAELVADVPEELRPFVPHWPALLVDVHRIDAGVPELADSLAALVVRLEQAMHFQDIDAVLAELERVARGLGDRQLYNDLVLWVRLRFKRDHVPGDWDKPLLTLPEVQTMMASYVKQWRKEFRAEGLAKGLAEGEAKGLAEGEAKGLAKGLAKGEAKGRAEGALNNQKENLLDTLTDRFDAVPQAILDAVARATDLDILRELTRAARRIESLAAFQALMDTQLSQ